MKRILSLLIGFLVCSIFSVHAQMDTEFWFAAPSLTTEHQVEHIYLTLVAYDEDAEVEVTMPAAGITIMPKSTLEAQRVYQISLKKTVNENTAIYNQVYATLANQTVQQRGIHIQSSAKITAYLVTTNSNSEIYTLKGTHGLGTDFIVPMQWRYRCGTLNSQAAGSDTNMKAHASIEVVATEDDTQVTFITRVPTNESDMPGTFTVTLNKGETYAIQSRQDDTPENLLLGGTRVMSNKPIAVNSTDDTATNFLTNGWGDKDLVGDQLVPTDFASSQYIVVANNSVNNGRLEYAYLYAIDQDTTEIYTHNGNAEVFVGAITPDNPIEVKLTPMVAQPFYTKDGKPFVFFQLTANLNGTEMGGTMLPSINCSGSPQVSYMPVLNTMTVHVSILTRTENIGSFVVNGSTYDLPASLFQPVQGYPEWSYAACVQINVPSKKRTINIANTKGVFHLGILDTGSGSSSYGYFSNYAGLDMQVFIDQDYYYEGENLTLALQSGELFDSIVWTGPRGEFGINNTNPVITGLTRFDEGMYIVNGTHKEGCEVTPDTFYINILSELDTTHIYACAKDSMVIHSQLLPPCAWFEDNNFLPQREADTLHIVPEKEATYMISGFKKGVNIMQWNALDVQLNTADSLIVWQQTFDHLLLGVEYRLSAHFTALQTNSVAPKIILQIGEERSPIIAVPNDTIGVEYTLSFTPSEPSTTAYIIVKAPKDGRSFRIDEVALHPILPGQTTIALHLIDAPQPVITGDTLLCNDFVELSASYPADSYLWSTGETDSVIIVSTPGEYSLQTETQGCVRYSEPITVKSVTRKTFALDSVATICAGDASVIIPFTVQSDAADYCDIHFDSNAQQAGWNDITNAPITNGEIVLTIPAGMEPGYYHGYVTITNDSCAGQSPLDFRLTILYSASIFAQRWNDILGIKNAAYNGGYEFVAFEWYKNGELMIGENNSYIYEPNQFQTGDTYRALLTCADGFQMFTCEYVPEYISYEDDGLESTFNIVGQSVSRPTSAGFYIVYKNGEATKIIRQ